MFGQTRGAAAVGRAGPGREVVWCWRSDRPSSEAFVLSTPGFRSGPDRAAKAVVWLLSGLLLGFFSWSAVVEMEMAALGEGRIVPSRQVQVVQNLEGGIVAAVLVKEGDAVEEGQVVARIADAEFQADIGEAKATRTGLRFQILRLQAEIEGRERLNFPAELVAEAPDLAAKELGLFQSKRAQLAAAVQGAGEEYTRAQNDAAKARESLPMLRASLNLAYQQREILAPQVADGLISKVELLSVDQKILELKGRISEAQRMIPGAQAVARQAHQQAAGEKAKARSEASAQLTEAKVKLKALEANLSAANDRVARREVRAPVKGIVKNLYARSLGQVMRPGEPLMDLVPSEDELLVEARFSPTDIAFVHEGMPATIRITAYDSSIYGALKAEVVQVAADATVPEQGEPYYLVKVRAQGGFDGAQGTQLPLKAGMVAQVNAITGKRTLLAYLFKPIATLQQRALRER